MKWNALTKFSNFEVYKFDFIFACLFMNTYHMSITEVKQSGFGLDIKQFNNNSIMLLIPKIPQNNKPTLPPNILTQNNNLLLTNYLKLHNPT